MAIVSLLIALLVASQGLVATQVRGLNGYPPVAMPCARGLDVAVLLDFSGSMRSRSRADLGLPQLDSLARWVQRCGGGLMVTVIGVRPEARLLTVAFSEVPSASRWVVSRHDTAGKPFRAAEVVREAAEAAAQRNRLLATRMEGLEPARRAFLERARVLITLPRDTAQNSPVCTALRDAESFFDRLRTGASLQRSLRVALINSDLRSTEPASLCPTSLSADLVVQLTDFDRNAVSITPRPVRAYALHEILAALSPLLER